jgi:hypothetical protein
MTMLFTRCADTSGGPLPAVNGTCSPSSSFYCPSRYESAQVYEIEPGERVTVIVDSDELLFVMFDDDDDDGGGSTAVLTIELISENPTRSLWVPKKTLLSKLLTRADIAHRFCVSASGGDPLCGEHGAEEEGVLWKRSSSPAASDASS